MDININIKNSMIKEVSDKNVTKNISTIDLTHLPFNKFTLTVTYDLSYERALQIVKNELPMLDVFDQIIKASKLIDKFKNDKNTITYNLTKEYLYISSKDIKITIKNTGILKLKGNKDPYDVEILAEDLIDEINKKPNQFEKNKFVNNLCIDYMNILLSITTIFNERKTTYNITENESTKVISKKKKNKSSKRNNITYIKYKNINITKNNNPSGRTYDRHTNSWIQRGHWRTYKSGKKVWIKECVKNAKDSSENKKINKTYEII